MIAARRNQFRQGGTRRGFTLVELLIVVTIIVILTAVAIPAVLPAITSRRVSEASRVLQAQIAAARDLATRANAPRGIRLLPDLAFPGPQGTEMLPLAYNRLVSLEGPPDYKEGFVTVLPGMGWNISGIPNLELPAQVIAHLQGFGPSPLTPFPNTSASQVLVIVEQKYHTISIPGTTPSAQLPVPNPPTNWYGNIRQGDKIYIPALKRYFSIAGPVPATINGQPNKERLIGIDPTWVWAFQRYNNRILYPQYPTTALPANDPTVEEPYWPPNIARDLPNWSGLPNMRWPEFLIVTNGIDDDGDGMIDEHFDGINNNPTLDALTDPAFDGAERPPGAYYIDDAFERNTGNPLDDLEWENDADLGLSTLADNPLESGALRGSEYRIIRRPVPAQGSSEVTLPGDVLIDATTVINVYGTAASNSRSRLPIGPAPSYYADFMIAPSGQVLQAAASFSQAPPMEFPFLHFWLAEREDIFPPYVGADNFLKLPIPKSFDTSAETNYPTGTYLTKGRRLLSVFTRTGQIVSNSVEIFDVNKSNLPFIAPQRGAREVQ